MNLFRDIADQIVGALRAMEVAGELPANLDLSAVTAEPPRDAAHGDVATNAAMVLAKGARKKPRDIADALAARLRAVPGVTEVSVAGPGFINIRLADDVWRTHLVALLKAGAAYGDSDLGKSAATINVEYVSA